MKKFPNEFADLLNTEGLKLLKTKSHKQFSFSNQQTPITGFPDVFKDPEKIYKLLDKTFDDCIKKVKYTVSEKFSSETESGQRSSIAFFDAKDKEDCSRKLLTRSEEVNINKCFTSPTLMQVIQRITGYNLLGNKGVQVNRYLSGDYIGMHSDFPSRNAAKHKKFFVDVHFAFANKHVDHQYLMYQQGEYLDQIKSVVKMGSMGLYTLPFFHQLTPLVAKSGKEKLAKRWLILTAFDIDQEYINKNIIKHTSNWQVRSYR